MSFGMIRTTTGFEDMPAATVWNGPGRPSETWSLYEPLRRVATEATRVVPRIRLTRVPAFPGESRPVKSTTWPNFVAPGARSVSDSCSPAAAAGAASARKIPIAIAVRTPRG